MHRRELITVLAGAATSSAVWPLAARAQQPARTNRKLGVLHPGQAAAVNARITAIREGLDAPDNPRDSLIELVTRLADGDPSRLPSLAADLVDSRVDAIMAAAPPAVQAASGATNRIPVIALDLESDPVASGFVASLARPGGNVTGVFLDFPEFSAKCLQLLIEAVPRLARVGVLWDPTTGSLQLRSVEAAAQGFGINLQVFETRRAADIAEAFYAVDRSRVQGVLMLSSPLIEIRNWSQTSRSGEPFRRFRCSPILQEKADCWPTGRKSRRSIARLPVWRAKCYMGPKRPSCRLSGRRDFN
jgi:putative ABC transport system substrate-binding protein